MSLPDWLKPGMVGAVVGAGVLAIGGFGYGGWMTEPSANRLAAKQAEMEVVIAMTPLCLQRSKTDPESSVTMAKLKEASSYRRDDILMETGWATMPGASEPSRALADACATVLSKDF